jgi:hypothetical protein
MHKNIYNARHRYLIVLPKGQLQGQKDSIKLKLYPFHIKHKKGKPPKKFMKNQHICLQSCRVAVVLKVREPEYTVGSRNGGSSSQGIAGQMEKKSSHCIELVGEELA